MEYLKTERGDQNVIDLPDYYKHTGKSPRRCPPGATPHQPPPSVEERLAQLEQRLVELEAQASLSSAATKRRLARSECSSLPYREPAIRRGRWRRPYAGGVRRPAAFAGQVDRAPRPDRLRVWLDTVHNGEHGDRSRDPPPQPSMPRPLRAFRVPPAPPATWRSPRSATARSPASRRQMTPLRTAEVDGTTRRIEAAPGNRSRARSQRRLPRRTGVTHIRRSPA